MPRRGLTLLELLVVLAILISLATIVTPMISTIGRKSQQISTRENLLRLQDLLVNRYVSDMGALPRPATLGLSANRTDHPQLRYLFINPDTESLTATPGATLLSNRHWQGPYVPHSGARYVVDETLVDDNNVPSTSGRSRGFTSTYGVGDDSSGYGGDPTILDAWGRPIVVQEPPETSTAEADDPTAAASSYARLVSAGPNGRIDTPRNARMPDNSTSATTGRSDDIILFLYRPDKYSEIQQFLRLEP